MAASRAPITPTAINHREEGVRNSGRCTTRDATAAQLPLPPAGREGSGPGLRDEPGLPQRVPREVNGVEAVLAPRPGECCVGLGPNDTAPDGTAPEATGPDATGPHDTDDTAQGDPGADDR